MTCRSVAGLFTPGLHVVPAEPPARALLPPSRARRPCGLGDSGWRCGPPGCSLPSLHTINRPCTQLRSLSPRAEPQMYFMGEKLPRWVVKHPGGASAAPRVHCRRGLQLWATAGAARTGARQESPRVHRGLRGWRVDGRVGVQEKHRLAALHQPHAAPRQALGGPRHVARVQLTLFDRGSQVGCGKAKGLIKYLAVN